MRSNELRTLGLALAALTLVFAAACGDDDNPGTDVDGGVGDGGGEVCMPGARECDGSDVVECAADGSGFTVVETCAESACMDGECTVSAGIESLIADPPVVDEGSDTIVQLSASHRAAPTEFSWRQTGGPARGLGGRSAEGATLDVSDIEVGSDTVFTFELTTTTDTGSAMATDTETVEVVVRAVDLVPARPESVARPSPPPSSSRARGAGSSTTRAAASTPPTAARTRATASTSAPTSTTSTSSRSRGRSSRSSRSAPRASAWSTSATSRRWRSSASWA
ncbi:MAG TPA: hypothetical protein RMH85_21405 [Polyangiaceae bacterium LLY-WYZ-15_(1-7)]|nr:hypothetical protein [Myxococcales bacterium]MAT24368.1 hypothetical protein [Sandaracinus sp.]HJK91244.1 hypothetical protein [Polyangiaceae bacterium LLY-WYZ-15_(1-7)]MBJ72256.1 hypothetical protein [Sandaracinus sp.]HJL02083.1 hypothetical protein [Polyangiaceae bacterium LLY-WYZ-15_(1-7)]